ncbi:Metacaspase-4 [Striga hermonthica]|uniref:Metacaspase-4 n=1 Tax=Striga hermonthica TaxID=68872 RepID=A0A9N7MT71_STRHE|nr:Metacaspase-4 [Striga hermonthica]
MGVSYGWQIQKATTSRGRAREGLGSVGDLVRRLEEGFRAGLKKFLQEKVEDETESRGFHLNSLGEENGTHIKNRSLPLSTLIDILKQKTGKDDIDVGKLRPTLFDIFGDDSSPKVKKFMKCNIWQIERRERRRWRVFGNGGGLAQQFLKQKLQENNDYAKPALETHVGRKEEVYAGATKRALPDSDILMSGCQTDQTSADATPSGDPSRAYGALSDALQTIIAESDGTISNQDLVLKLGSF